MCLTDNSFKNLPTGNIIDTFLWELSHRGFQGRTDSNSYFKTSLYHGEYEVKVSHPATATAQTFKFQSTSNTHKAVLKFKILQDKGTKKSNKGRRYMDSNK